MYHVNVPDYVLVFQALASRVAWVVTPPEDSFWYSFSEAEGITNCSCSCGTLELEAAPCHPCFAFFSGIVGVI